VLGLLVAKWAGSVLLALLASGRNPVTIDLFLDSRILAFTAGVSVVSGVLFGLVPAWRATRPDLLPALKQNSQGATSAKAIAGKLLVGGQVALCLLLLVGAGLMLRTLQTLKKLDIGFDRENLLIFTARPGLNGYKDQRLQTFYQDMQRRLQSIPG